MIPNRKAVVSIGLLAIAGTVQAATTFINTCPFVISSPGDYLLSADLFCSSAGNGITITSSHVTLKLEGHTMRSGGSNIAISNSSGEVNTPVTDVHILGPGLIHSFSTGPKFVVGVSLLGSVTDSEMSGITVQGSTTGIEALGAANTGLTLTKNTVVGSTVGIVVGGFTSSTISENVASDNTIGIEIANGGVTGGSPIMLRQNKVIGNLNTGVDIETGFVTAQNNIISGNSTIGINVTARLGATIALEITNNTALANGLFDLNDTVPNCTGSVWSGNTFFTANQSCIH